MVKVISYNIHGGMGFDGDYDLARTGGIIRRSGCDIACLQDVEVNFELKQQRQHSARHCDNQAEQLARSSGLCYYSFAGPLNAHLGEVKDRPKETSCLRPYEEILVRDKESKAGCGNAILSRYPILDSRHLNFGQDEPLSEDYIYMDREQQPRGMRAVLVDTHPPKAQDTGAAAEGQAEATPRSPSLICCSKPVVTSSAELVTRATPSNPKGARKSQPVAPLWVVNTHLSHKIGSAEQRSQVQQLLAFIETLVQEPEVGLVKPGVILCGDLNAAPFMPHSAYSILSSDSRLVDAWQEKGSFCNQATFPTRCASASCGLHLAHIFMLRHAQAAPLECQAIRVLSSYEDSEGSDHRPILAEVDFLP